MRTRNIPLSCEVPGVNVEIRRAIGRHIVIALNVQQAHFDRAELVRYASMPGVVVAVVAGATVNVIVCAEVLMLFIRQRDVQRAVGIRSPHAPHARLAARGVGRLTGRTASAADAEGALETTEVRSVVEQRTVLATAERVRRRLAVE